MQLSRDALIQPESRLNRTDIQAQEPNDYLRPSPIYVRLAILVIFWGGFVSLILLRVLEPEQKIRTLGPITFIAISAVSWFLSSRGLLKASLLLLIFGSWISATGMVVFNGGLQAPMVIVYPLLILLSGWVVGLRAAFTMSTLTILVTLYIIFLNDVSAPPHTDPALQGWVQIIIYVISAILVTFMVRSYYRKIEELHQLSKKLSERTLDLEASKTELIRAQTAAKVGSWVFDIPQDIIRMSDECCRIFCLPEGTTGTQDSFLAQVYKEDRISVLQAWQESLKGRSFDKEHRIKVGEELRWVRQKSDIRFSAEGKPIRAEGITQDINERKLSENRIHSLAFFDQLTGLPNRTLLLDRLNQMMASSESTRIYCSLLFLDLDHFKVLNDTRGHDIGDKLLIQTAQRLSACLREEDTVARFGGDEFVVLLGNLSASSVEATAATELVARKILEELKLPYQLGNADHHVTASIGVTLFNGTTISIDNLLKQADLTMYKAKSAGRNICCFFNPGLEKSANERASIERDLRKALAEQEFALHYQAQVADRGRFTGAEVLLRWHHPHRGLVSPADFIPLAEETGLIIPIGKWVLHKACAQLASWADIPAMASLCLSVNVSVQQFNQHDFVETVLEALASTGALADHLKLELTENLFVDNVQGIIEKMIALKSIGVGFSLDDFGTGYSSLTYLKRMPFDQLKIDQSFVRDILIDQNDATIAKTIIALGKSFSLSVIAEGVETKAQLEALANFGCREYQGYFLSRPVPLKTFEQLILNT